jgi:DNA polymerase/3'-5' exonuclease PolX
MDAIDIRIAKDPAVGTSHFIRFAGSKEHATSIRTRRKVRNAMPLSVGSYALQGAIREVVCSHGFNDLIHRELRTLLKSTMEKSDANPDGIGHT